MPNADQLGVGRDLRAQSALGETWGLNTRSLPTPTKSCQRPTTRRSPKGHLSSPTKACRPWCLALGETDRESERGRERERGEREKRGSTRPWHSTPPPIHWAVELGEIKWPSTFWVSPNADQVVSASYDAQVKPQDQTRSNRKSQFLGCQGQCTPQVEIPGRGVPVRYSTS